MPRAPVRGPVMWASRSIRLPQHLQVVSVLMPTLAAPTLAALRLAALRLATLTLAALATLPATATAQDTLPPHLGGYVRSLGLPPTREGYVALALDLDRSASGFLNTQVRLGVNRPLGSPVTHLLSVAGEAYGGVRGGDATAGVRALALTHLFGFGAGLDVDAVAERADPFVTLVSPIRRGGVAGRGSDLRLDIYPWRSGALSLSLTGPLRPGYRGRTRPKRDYVRLHHAVPRPLTVSPTPKLAASLARLSDGAHWINRLMLPPLRHGGRAPAEAVAVATAPLRQRLAGRTAADEIEAFHDEVDRAFSLAVGATGGVTPAGREVAVEARRVLLQRVLFPYNRLLGQRKRIDGTVEFAVHARGAFARWVITESTVPPERAEAALYVFQHLLDAVERARVANHAAWGDSRLVWLPLQLALRPRDYVLQEALDSLVSDAVGRRIVHGNRMWYVYNERFQRQIVESIGEAEEYHILWVHDFRGLNAERQPDRLSLLLATRAYLSALTQRVAAYDSVGRLPAYMLFLDQHYFELNASRDLLALLQDPLHHVLRLPPQHAGLADTIASWQGALRDAVNSSRLLTAERGEYGERWLRRLVKVHVSVTHPADPSFRSDHILRFVGTPDDLMRDHRKAVVYDVSEEDPYRGMAMYAGMGVGEHYASDQWDDRAIMIQGPAAITLRDAARTLLQSQGIREGAVPHVLRPRQRPPDYDARVQSEIVAMDDWGGVATRAVELHNATGFGPKEIAVAQATLFNLTSPGAVFKVPDSLWMNELLACLLGGAALRGTRVLPIAPSAASAPAPDLGLPGIHDTFSRLLAFRHAMAAEIEMAGGMLRPGLYHTASDVKDLGFRVQALGRSLERYDFMRELYPTLGPVLALASGAMLAPASLTAGAAHTAGTAGTPTTAATAGSAGADQPFAKLHMKGFLYVSGDAWSTLYAGPLMVEALQVYLAQRSRQVVGDPAADEKAMGDALQLFGVESLTPLVQLLGTGVTDRWAFFLQIGSPNLDYRSMLLDGEVALLVSGWTSLYASFDFVLLTGLVTWLDTQEQLDTLVPPGSAVKQRVARWIRIAL
jgi:hypothetical protein